MMRCLMLCLCFTVATCYLYAGGDEAAPSKLAVEFREKCAQKAEDARTMTIRGVDGWLFLRKELRHIGVGRFWGERAAEVSRATRAKHANPLEAIVHYHKQCKKQNVELIILPIPPKAVVYPEKAVPSLASKVEDEPPRLDPAHRTFYKLLREKGVNVIDPTELLLRHRDDKAGATYCKQDSHYSGRACGIIAEKLAETIKQKVWYADVPRKTFTAETHQVQINGDLRQGLEDADMPKETLPLTQIKQDGAPIKPDSESPVLLLGDSHTLVFHSGGKLHAKASGLADHLAHDLGFRIDVLGVRGSGARPARISLFRRARKEGYLARKELIIWCFSAREFTESAWGKIPLKR